MSEEHVWLLLMHVRAWDIDMEGQALGAVRYHQLECAITVSMLKESFGWLTLSLKHVRPKRGVAMISKRGSWRTRLLTSSPNSM